MGSIAALPIWKKGSTPAEWLQEVAAMAMEHPERFARIVVVYERLDEDGERPIETRNQSYGVNANTTIIAMLEYCKLDVWELIKGRR